MKKAIVKISASSLIAVTCALGAGTVLSVPAFAQDAPMEGRQFGAKAGQIVNDAMTMGNEKQYSAAISKLNEALGVDNLNAYESATIYQMLGSYYYELDQLQSAISNFEKAINSGGLLPNEAQSLEVNIAQLMIANGQYRQGAERLEAWMRRTGDQKPKYIEFVMQAWVQDENYSKALPWAEKWFRAANPKERRHFDLLNFLYNNLGMQGRQADIVKEMIVRWPEDRQLWDNWMALLANGGREKEAFEVNKMLYLGGAMSSESDLLKIVQYYSYYDMPFQAAQILEREMNAGKISRNAERLVQLSDLFRQAREYRRALPVLEAAANASGKAKSWADLGEALYNEGDCAKAETAFNKAMNMGYDKGKSWMLIANCRYEDGQNEQRPTCEGTTEEQRRNSPKAVKNRAAIEAFRKVPATSREHRDAQKWISFVSDENASVEERCEFIKNLERDLCYIKIENAYRAQLFKGGQFILKEDDEYCMKFKPGFDEKFRRSGN